ncbi:DUF1145 domain-containing protein [Psychromonas sp. RZ22]|uniref:DUF1145 domain-containing protein n=1 Tax=Psychromonas algarum TaxID=2555643 RepID=UPI001067D669|nr:DUF1145 domain-containing protein [Psychromonas sp. RZ22]TEW53757.1 DUF1145 domain-containing protein [Psychromonas sp. RZ22]
MASYFIPLAKILMGLIWGLLIINLALPFPGQLANAAYFLLVFICIVHLIQLLIIKIVFAKKVQLDTKETLSIFFFGAFKLWQIKTKLF